MEGRWFSPKYKTGVWDGRIRFVKYDSEAKCYRFPSGFLDRVCLYLKERELSYSVEDRRTLGTYDAPCYQLHSNEHGTVRLDQGRYSFQGEAVDKALQFGRGILHLPTNAGKTVIGAAFIKSLNRRTVWFTHLRSLLYQTQRRLSEFLEMPVGIIGDGKCKYEEVTVAMVQTCSQRDHDMFLKTCDVVIGDECHHLESKLWINNFAQVPAAWRIGLTATPDLRQEGMNLLAMTGGIIYVKTPLEMISLGVSVPPRIWFATCNAPNLRASLPYQEVYRLGVVECIERHKIILDACQT